MSRSIAAIVFCRTDATPPAWSLQHKEVRDYIEMQKDYQHRVMICDREDFCVFEMIAGQIVHPSPETVEAFHKERQEPGGMELKL